MRFFFSTLILTVGFLAARADEPTAEPALAGVPPLLGAALLHHAVDVDHWAFTQTTVTKNGKGKIKEQAVVRYDPSQHYDVQWTPLSIDGQPATAAQIKEYRRDHARDSDKRRTLGELLNFRAATVAEETPSAVIYEVPLSKDDNQRLPPEKFRVTVRVNKERRVFEQIAVRVREAMRVKLVAKIKSGGAVLDFASVDPKYSPPVTTIQAGGTASVFFVTVGGAYDLTRTDFKRVTPYNDRFRVKLGPLKTIDF